MMKKKRPENFQDAFFLCGMISIYSTYANPMVKLK